MTTLAILSDLIKNLNDPEASSADKAIWAESAATIVNSMVEAERAPDTRKSLHTLMMEVADARRMVNRTYRHKGDDDIYSLLMIAFDERTNETIAVYGLAAMPALKFTCPLEKFKDSFEEDHGAATR